MTGNPVFDIMKELHEEAHGFNTTQSLDVEFGQQTPLCSNNGSFVCCPNSADSQRCEKIYQDSLRYLAKIIVRAYLRDKGL